MRVQNLTRIGLLAMVVAALALSGCTAVVIGGGTILPTRTPAASETPGTPAPTTSTTPTTPTPGGTITPTVTATPVSGAKASATLQHVPVGSAFLSYNLNAHTLQVQYAFVGLAPNSAHPMQLNAGNCISYGPILYPIDTVTADATGNAAKTVTISNVTTSQPSSGWFIDLHNGSGTSTYDTLALACANVPTLLGPSGQPATGTVTFTEGVGPNMTATGYAQFSVQSGALFVSVTADGLEPGSTHPLFVRQGTCEKQSNTTFHGLYPLTASSAGSAKSTTQITNVSSVPSGTWYVIAYRGVNLDSYLDSAPILCGNVLVAK
jgi:hypothetical protein